MVSLATVGLLLIGLLAVQAKHFTVSSPDGSIFSVSQGIDQKGICFAYYSDDVERIGWGTLIVNTTKSSSSYSDAKVAEAAGYLEGYLTSERIYQSWVAYESQFTGSETPAALLDWVANNTQWMQSMISSNAGDPFWANIEIIQAQLNGLADGYNAACAPKSPQLTVAAIFLLNSGGDTGDIVAAIQANATAGSPESKLLEGFRPLKTAAPHWGSHCSVLIKPTADLSELYAAHTTWSGFSGMLRTYKIYNLKFQQANVSAVSSSFSAYPATVSSIDDFYVLSSNMIVMETTNGVFNNSLYSLVTPQSLVSWMRVVTANRMATNGQQWTQIFARYNSGTYNNQWQVVDYNKFTPGQAIQDDTLWIVEQIPGQCESADVSSLLRTQGYFPSYNIPYFPNIYNISGFNDAVSKYGYWFDYHLHPRAQIFAHEQSQISNLNWMKYMMRFNEWQTDPIAKGNSINAIASRGDLVNQTNPNPFLELSAFGGIDSKIGSYEMTRKLHAAAISGPTFQEQPYFRWTDQWKDTVHVGQPEIFNFDWNLFHN